MRSVSILIGLCLLQVLLSANLCWKNVLVNGNFEQNHCYSEWCIFNQGYCPVPGWIARNEIQIGHGYLYHPHFPHSRVAQLDANGNTCIVQKVRVGRGTHWLKFDFAARIGCSVHTSQFKVYFNGRQIANICPQDFTKIWINIPVNVDYCPPESELMFCGTGASDGLGAIIDNVTFESLLPC